MKFGISQSIPRKEDAALLRGAGRYVADALPPGTLHAVVLRSPHAHARLKIADTARARALPGVRLVLTARDAEVAALGLLPCTEVPPDVKVDVPPYPVLARDEVMHVGDAVAFVVADTLEHAKDAAEAIAVEYTPLPHVVDAVAALAPGAPAVWPRIGERSDAVLRTAIGERSDAVLRTAIGERSDAVLRTAMPGHDEDKTYGRHVPHVFGGTNSAPLGTKSLV
jgi:carbon-monoxide dehydrogenase large subunit